MFIVCRPTPGNVVDVLASSQRNRVCVEPARPSARYVVLELRSRWDVRPGTYVRAARVCAHGQRFWVSGRSYGSSGHMDARAKSEDDAVITVSTQSHRYRSFELSSIVVDGYRLRALSKGCAAYIPPFFRSLPSSVVDGYRCSTPPSIRSSVP
jgi:hypothetical protein